MPNTEQPTLNEIPPPRPWPDPFAIPESMLPADKFYQWASLGQVGTFETMKKLGWSVVPFERHSAEASDRGWHYDVRTGGIERGNLILVEKNHEEVEQSREDDKIVALLAEAAARSALMGLKYRVFDDLGDLAKAGNVKQAFEEVRAAYADREFRNAHRDEIRMVARGLAVTDHHTPDMLVSLSPPVERRINGIMAWIFTKERQVPLWRLYEPAATLKVKENLNGRN